MCIEATIEKDLDFEGEDKLLPIGLMQSDGRHLNDDDTRNVGEIMKG